MKPNPRVLDISHHNWDSYGPLGWNQIKSAGIWGIIHKATESTDYIDPYYQRAKIEATQEGLLFGAYHFFRPGNVAAQAQHFLSVAQPTRDMLVVLDHEDDGCSIADVKEWMRIVESATGQRPALYSGHLIKEQLGDRNDDYLAEARLWIAQYGDEPEWPDNWDELWLWQFTDGEVGPQPHSIPGIGSCDINSFIGSRSALRASWSPNMQASKPDRPDRPDRPEKPDANVIPTWLAAMRAITGMTEVPGSADNPHIMMMADYIAKKYPQQADYASLYTGDDVAWCGLTVGFCMAVADITPVFGPTDTDRWMWAQAWGGKYWAADEIKEPRLGCVAVMQREGGGHVCLVEAWTEGSNQFISGGQFKGRGGNQSDMVNVSTQSVSNVIAWMWPRAGGSIPMPAVSGEDATAWVQASLNILGASLEIDGEYGPATKGAIEDFQKDHDLRETGFPDKETTAEILGELDKLNDERGEDDGPQRK